MMILGIETSCDETAVAVIEDGYKVRSNLISSQIAQHSLYGGVVPELAAREHLKAIKVMVTNALEKAHISAHDLDAVAVTHSPGLQSALLVGISYAKGLALGLGIPLIGVNHFLAHIYGAMIDRPDILHDADNFPLLALVVSGGHTALVLIDGHHQCRLIGRTIDDAAGEAFDKAAKILHLGYPGGPLIDRLAAFGNPERYHFPRGLVGGSGTATAKHDRLNFSFSGVKTALLYHIQKQGLETDGNDSTFNQENPEFLDTIASYQEAIVDALITKCLWAIADHEVKTVVVCGGVACNRRLRAKMSAALTDIKINLIITPPVYCTDNGAMIAGLAYYMAKNQYGSELSLDAKSKLDCNEIISFY